MNFFFSYKSNPASIFKIYPIFPLEFLLTALTMCDEIFSKYFS